ncbi:MAG: hypothetical protein C4B58_16035 [Deltaproteobacteria bacterium]|nr:MAG: hypothetical protein C4B58_16035 [Deltaproteobacteria bacterium]
MGSVGNVGNKSNLKALLPYSLALAIILVRMHTEREFSNDKEFRIGKGQNMHMITGRGLLKPIRYPLIL